MRRECAGPCSKHVARHGGKEHHHRRGGGAGGGGAADVGAREHLAPIPRDDFAVADGGYHIGGIRGITCGLIGIPLAFHDDYAIRTDVRVRDRLVPGAVDGVLFTTAVDRPATALACHRCATAVGAGVDGRAALPLGRCVGVGGERHNEEAGDAWEREHERERGARVEVLVPL